MTYWLVGDAPTRETLATPESWLTPDASGRPSPANRLLALTGWTLQVFLRTFAPRRNLWVNPNRVWTAEGRAQAAKIVTQSFNDGSDGVVVLGMRAASMFDLDANEPMTWRGRFAFVPHTAKQSQFWTPEHRAQALAFFGGLLKRSAPRRVR